MGVKEQIIFPEIEYDKVDRVRGYGYYHYNDCFVPTKKGRALLAAFSFPFPRNKEVRKSNG